MTEETESQRVQRSALGGFERDAKTFQGHLERISASAEAFVKRCAKFALQEPGHYRLAETAELLAEAKRISGQEGAAVPTPDPGEYPPDISMAVTAMARWIVRNGLVGAASEDDRAAVACLRVYLRERNAEPPESSMPTEVVASDGGTEVASMDARAGVPALLAQPTPGYSLETLQPDAAARVQAALDAAAEKAAPAPVANPLASYFAQQQ